MIVKKVGIVGMGEAGNFGDDLILVAINQAVVGAIEGADVQFTSHGYPLDWDSISSHLKIQMKPRSVNSSRDLPGSRSDSLLFADRDVVLFGGGGLFETSHHPCRPYHWIRYLPRRRPLVPVLAVGVGMGPLSPIWRQRLKEMGSPFTECYLRDSDSLKYAEDVLQWEATRCRDFIDEAFLAQFGVSASQNADSRPRQLGVAVRSWPGLKAEELATHIENVAKVEQVDSVRFFVLEARGRSGPDLPFAEQVLAKIKSRPASIRTYLGTQIIDFIQDMTSCSVAISMKLHSSALWSAAGVRIYPIFYAPKTASLFGRNFQGLEIFNQAMQTVADDEWVPRAQDVTKKWLMAEPIATGSKPRATLRSSEALKYQCVSLGWNIKQKAARLI